MNSDRIYVFGLPTLGTFNQSEGHSLSIAQVSSLAVLREDGTVMNKDLIAIFTNDETKSLGSIEPLDDAFFSWSFGGSGSILFAVVSI
jgi:hypothetical protein